MPDVRRPAAEPSRQRCVLRVRGDGVTAGPSSTPMRAIRRMCVSCSGGVRAATRCTREECPLHVYRTGRNPQRAGIGRAMSSEDARLCRKGTSQVVLSEKKKSGQGDRYGAGEIEAHRSNKREISSRQRRRIVQAAETILRAVEGDR